MIKEPSKCGSKNATIMGKEETLATQGNAVVLVLSMYVSFCFVAIIIVLWGDMKTMSSCIHLLGVPRLQFPSAW